MKPANSFPVLFLNVSEKMLAARHKNGWKGRHNLRSCVFFADFMTSVQHGPQYLTRTKSQKKKGEKC